MTNRFPPFTELLPQSARALRGLPTVALVAALTALGLSACAWSYASQRDEPGSKKKREAEPKVVDVPGPSEDDSSKRKPSAAPDGPDAGPREPVQCAVETFDVHFYDESERVTKRISCKHREVVDVQRSAVTEAQLKVAREAGLPEETWYILVDPEGTRSKFLSRQELLEVSREFDVQFLGRDAERQLLIYEYRADL